MSTDLVPFQDQQRMAQAIAKSGFFGLKDETQVLALMAVAQAEGRHPASVAKDYHIIQNRPALKADAMLARFQKAGGMVQWAVYKDEQVTGVFSHPQGGTLEVTWTLAQAKAIGLATKDNWKLYPRAMLRARVISEGIRAVYPGVIVGEYSVEEVQDFDVRPTAYVPHIEITDELDEEPKWPFYVPMPDGARKLHKSCVDGDDFMQSYSDMVEKICASKLSGEEQDKKIELLQDVNSETLRLVGR